MPYRRPTISRARRRAQLKRQLMIGGGALAVVALLIIAITAILGGQGGDQPVSAPAPTSTPLPTVAAVAEVPEAGDESPVDEAEGDIPESDIDSMLSEDDEAEGEPAAPASTPAPDRNSTRAATRPTATAEGFLPVFSHAENTEEKIIAITVDDCFQAENLRKIVDCAIENGGKITLFPTGQNAIRSEQSKVLKDAWEKGMELENHTFTHSGLFNVTDELLADQIYQQQMALCHVLNQEYQCHFLRPRGGDARNDQRMHMYAKQLGYYGIAHWSVDGSKSTDKQLAKGLKPGAIFLFHTTDNDWSILERFIPWVVQQGYKMVTLNEMFDYPDNEADALTTPAKDRPSPTIAPYERVYTTLKATTYSWYAYELQQKLIELGYLTGEPDGVYGDGCAAAVSAYQKDKGLEVTGKAEPELLKELLG